LLAAVWAFGAGATGPDAFDTDVTSLLSFGRAEAGVELDTDCRIHGAAGKTGIVHAGRMKTSAGIARWPITAAVQTACRDAADLLRNA
jgi:hypothetical protein